MDSNGWFIFQFCLSWTIFVRILPSFVCHGQLWLECIAVLSVADNIDWFIPRFSLSWTILVVIYPWFVCHEQNWLVYHPVLSVMDNKGWYFSQFFSVVDKNWLVYQPVLSVVDKNSWYINRFCRSWTILGGIFHGCVLLGQYWLVNQSFFIFHGQ